MGIIVLGWLSYQTGHPYILYKSRLASPAECGGRKPREERGCHLQSCSSMWLTGEWGRCEAGCGLEGERGREVQCLLDGASATSCRLSERPDIRENCLGACPDEEDNFDLSEREGDELEEREEEMEEAEEELLEELLEEEEEREINRKGMLSTGKKYVEAVVTVIEDNIKDIQLGGQVMVDKKLEENAKEKTRKEMSNEIVVEKHKKGSRGPDCRDKFKNCQVLKIVFGGWWSPLLFTIYLIKRLPLG